MAFLRNVKILKNSNQFDFVKSHNYFYFMGKCGIYRVAISNALFNYRPNTSLFNLYLRKLELGFRGISDGYFVELYLYGIGYRAWIISNKLYLQLGYNNIICYVIRENFIIKARKNKIVMFNYEKQQLNEQAKLLYLCKVPDVYRGKGVRFKDQVIKFKAGKQR